MNNLNRPIKKRQLMTEHTMRLNTYLARAGYGSRREATEIIAAGRVKLNGEVQTNPLLEFDANQAHVRVDGKLIKRLWPRTYILMHKPVGSITATKDTHKRPTVYELLGRYRTVVQAVGRLDYDTEGVLLFTNDGGLANALTSPGSKVPKIYRVKVKGHPSPMALEKLRTGVDIGNYVTQPAKVKFASRLKANSWLRITLIEGKYRQIKRMTEVVGHPTLKLVRVAFGPLILGKLPPGKIRHLENWEVQKLNKLIKQ